MTELLHILIHIITNLVLPLLRVHFTSLLRIVTSLLRHYSIIATS